MDEKIMNTARKRFDKVLMDSLREYKETLSCFKKDGVLWVADDGVLMHYYELDYLLDRDKLLSNDRIGDVIDRVGRYGITIPAEITKRITLSGGSLLYAVFSDGVNNEICVPDKSYKIFGDKFIYCIHSGTLAVYNKNELCGIISPLKFKEED